ncbi:MAG: DUF1015 domain-containing protein [Phycisphaerae bacterium]
MSTIRPFTAIRYAASQAPRGDLSTRLAPPYDILDQSDKERLLAADPLNFVKIDLPHVPPKSAGPDSVYRASRQTLDAWLADGTMLRDPQPMLYAYHQKFQHEGRDYTRRMLFARLRLEPFGTGTVFPHEQTFGGPKEDRLALTKATQANLSPIFGLFEDAANEVSDRLEAALPEKRLCCGRVPGTDVDNLLWGISDSDTINAVQKLLQPKPIFIADGHHRYGTGLLYRDWLTQQEGALPDEHPANYVLAVLCAMEDSGLLILPTHRVLPGVKATADIFQADPQVEVSKMGVTDPAEAVRALAAFGPQAVACYDPATKSYSALRPCKPEILDALEPEHSPAWRRLGLAFLHAYLLDRLVTPKLCGGQAPTIQYIKAAEPAVDTARETSGVAFLMQPTTMEEMRGVCSAGDLMPQKSTYFNPKLASGLVVNPLRA